MKRHNKLYRATRRNLARRFARDKKISFHEAWLMVQQEYYS